MMDRQDAYTACSTLVAAFPGFDDRSIDVYAAKFAVLDDFASLTHAVNDVIETYDRPGRPPVALVLEAYRAQRRRVIMARPALISGSKPVAPKEGRVIAARAYARQCETEGREPDWARFDRIIGTVTG